jgi:hypothetical protein
MRRGREASFLMDDTHSGNVATWQYRELDTGYARHGLRRTCFYGNQVVPPFARILEHFGKLRAEVHTFCVGQYLNISGGPRRSQAAGMRRYRRKQQAYRAQLEASA